eukprot:scaffold5537_cov112-Isochrysis_galbana.AAC.10
MGSRRPQTHMHSLGLLLSITFRTILPAQRALDTFGTRKTDQAASGWMRDDMHVVAHPHTFMSSRVSSRTCLDVARRFWFGADRRSEQSLPSSDNTEPGPIQTPTEFKKKIVHGY